LLELFPEKGVDLLYKCLLRLLPVRK
jgi:hypothetical protein